MSMSERQKQNADWQERLARLREVLRPTEVRPSHVPQWLRQRLVRAFDCRGRNTSGRAVLHCALYQHFRDEFGGSDISWLDHWGSARHPNGVVFVSEPYQVFPRTVALLDSFAKRLGIEWYLSATSWWYPGRTIRIVFYEPKEKRGSRGTVTNRDIETTECNTPETKQ